ncbi:hypothetical protein AAGG52_23555 [Bacillus licheniformis]
MEEWWNTADNRKDGIYHDAAFLIFSFWCVGLMTSRRFGRIPSEVRRFAVCPGAVSITRKNPVGAAAWRINILLFGAAFL